MGAGLLSMTQSIRRWKLKIEMKMYFFEFFEYKSQGKQNFDIFYKKFFEKNFIFHRNSLSR